MKCAQVDVEHIRAEDAFLAGNSFPIMSIPTIPTISTIASTPR